jgi:pseudaminic acid cytidylyltransferase
MSILCVIPARGGSKRIPGKNIKSFLGKPIIAYSIESAIASGIFDEVMVSTESEKIAELAKKYGASIPFLRSVANSDDYTGLAVVLQEVLKEYEIRGSVFDFVCCILPTAPFITEKKLQDAYGLILTNEYDCVFSVTEYSYPIQRSLKIDDGFIKMNWPENINTRSQDLNKNFHDAGQLYIIHSKTLKDKGRLFTDRSGCLILSNLEIQDIDTEEDWKLAEMKYKLIHEK